MPVTRTESFDRQLQRLGKARAALIHGADPIMVAEYRTRLANHVLGESATDDLAKVHLSADDVRTDSGIVEAALKEQGMFGDARVVIVDDANISHRKALERAFDNSSPDDWQLIVTAKEQKSKSALVNLFKDFAHGAIFEAQVPQYSKEEIQQYFQAQKIGAPDADALDRLAELRDQMTWGTFQKLLEKISIYMYGETEPVSVGDVDACAPTRHAQEAEGLFDAVARCDEKEIAERYAALLAKGDRPSSIMVQIEWQFKFLHQAAVAGVREFGGRPPSGLWVRQDRRSALNAHLRDWNLIRLESVLAELQNADLGLRGSTHIPDTVLAEHVLLRIAHLRPRKSAA